MKTQLGRKNQNIKFPFVHRSLHLNLAATAVALLIAVPAFGQIIVADSFESPDTVGSFPFASGWIGSGAGTLAVKQVVNGSALPNPSNPTQVMSLDNTGVGNTGVNGYDILKNFTSTTLVPGDPYLLSFDLRIEAIPAGSAGFGNAGVRLVQPSTSLSGIPEVITAAVSGDPSKFNLGAYTGSFTPIETGLSTGLWYNVKLLMQMSSPTAGTATWILDNVTNGTTTAFTMAGPVGWIEITDVAVWPGGSMLVDNVQFEAIPEPSTVLLLGAGVCLFWRARHGHRA